MTTDPRPARSPPRRVGTGLLVAVVVGSGIFAERLSPDDVGLQLLENSTATAGGLVALILAFGRSPAPTSTPSSPSPTGSSAASPPASSLAYIPAQIAGACVGAVVANLMFDLDADHPLRPTPAPRAACWLGEVVATFGLLLVILGVVRSGRAATAPFAVAGYIAAAYWFTSSTSFANPAVTIGRTLSDTFAGIAPSSAPGVHRRPARRRRSSPSPSPASSTPTCPPSTSSSPTTTTEAA